GGVVVAVSVIHARGLGGDGWRCDRRQDERQSQGAPQPRSCRGGPGTLEVDARDALRDELPAGGMGRLATQFPLMTARPVWLDFQRVGMEGGQPWAMIWTDGVRGGGRARLACDKTDPHRRPSHVVTNDEGGAPRWAAPLGKLLDRKRGKFLKSYRACVGFLDCNPPLARHRCAAGTTPLPLTYRRAAVYSTGH